MIGYVAALLYGALTLIFIAALGLAIDSPVVIFWIVLASASAYLCQSIQLLWPERVPIWGAAWVMSLFFTLAAIVASAGAL